MSKASTWARSRPKSCEHGDTTVASVTAYGAAVINGYDEKGVPAHIVLHEQRAVAVARWILDTFGEPA